MSWRTIFVFKRIKSFNKEHCLYGSLGRKAFSKPVKRKLKMAMQDLTFASDVRHARA